MEERLPARRAAAEQPGAPAFPVANFLHRGPVEGHRQQHVEWGVSGLGNRTANHLGVASARFEGDGFRLNIDHRAVVIAGHGHEGIRDAAGERVGPTVHQFCQDVGHMLWIAGAA